MHFRRPHVGQVSIERCFAQPKAHARRGAIEPPGRFVPPRNQNGGLVFPDGVERLAGEDVRLHRAALFPALRSARAAVFSRPSESGCGVGTGAKHGDAYAVALGFDAQRP